MEIFVGSGAEGGDVEMLWSIKLTPCSVCIHQLSAALLLSRQVE